MEENIEINKVSQENPHFEEVDYKFNFVNTPWDDRTRNSKIGIVSLLAAIFIATVALVIHNLVIHYTGFDESVVAKISCNLVKVDKYPYIARIHSVSSNEILCLGVVISLSTVLANDVCVSSGPVRIRVGNIKDPRCKKGFPVHSIDTIPHSGLAKKSLSLLTTNVNMKDCAETIDIGTNYTMDEVHIIGRPHRGDKSLSFQIAKIVAENVTSNFTNNLDGKNLICVRGLSKCPVRISDVLLQDKKILGLASTSMNERELNLRMICFAKLSIIQNVLTELFWRSD